MATSKEYINFIKEQLSDLEELFVRSMMGEYLVYYRGKITAYVCDSRFLVKVVPASKALLPNAKLEPPYKGAKDMLLVEDVEDKALLTKLFVAMYDELPVPKK